MSETAEGQVEEGEEEQQQDAELSGMDQDVQQAEDAGGDDGAAEDEEYEDQEGEDYLPEDGEGESEGDDDGGSEGQEDEAYEEYSNNNTMRDQGDPPSVLSTPNDAPKGDLDDDMPLANRLSMLSSRSRSASSHASRPTSAVINLRGSRPNSAAIAQEIEGFEDDFMERVEEEEEYDYDERMAEEDEEQDLGPTVEELIDRGQQEQSRLQEMNDMLQKRARLALDLKNKGRPPVNRDLARLDGVSTRYKSALKLWVDTLEERDRVEAHYQTTIFDMKSMLEDRIKRADDISKAYKHFKLEVAKSAEHSKSGRVISERLLSHLEQEDQEKEEEVQRVRLKNIHLGNQLKRIEQTLRQKEELAEGLHLIDFEQLKIENQSLNEKIEERNEELLKLRKKTTTTVQILTHVREKLQFVEKENNTLAGQLQELDEELSEKRDRLGKAKSTRDTFRQQGRKIKQSSVYITNPGLLDDIEGQKEKKEQVTMQIEKLKQDYEELANTIQRNNHKIANMTEDLGGPSMKPFRQPSVREIKSQSSALGL